jgi:hypothetical protein
MDGTACSEEEDAAARRKGRRAKREVPDAEAESMEANRQIT